VFYYLAQYNCEHLKPDILPFLLPKEDQHTIETMHKVAGLLMRRLQETLSEEDTQVLEQWLATQAAEQREFYQTATEWPAIEAALQSFYHIEEKKALEDVWMRISESSPVNASPSAIRSMKRYWIAAAAAALILGIVAIGIRSKKESTDNITITQTEDVLPATNKATLQLADGSVITLDSTVNGTLAKQQNAVVINNAQGNGILSYKDQHTATIAYNKIVTQKGGQFQVVLPDGTHVWLNAATSLRYPTSFTGKERVVELSGEAYFEVASNSNQHFRVKITGDKTFDVEVLGTKFNISSYNEDKISTTTLVQGKVRVSNSSDAQLLQPDQKAVLTENSSISIRPADLEEALAWKNGLFYFQEGDIRDIMSEISRWYDVDVVFQGTVNQKVVAKIPRTMTLTKVLQVLEYTQSAHFKLEGKTVIVTP
jgi:ferric-dicitrate binding protein FerR (iron transport regulator)